MKNTQIDHFIPFLSDVVQEVYRKDLRIVHVRCRGLPGLVAAVKSIVDRLPGEDLPGYAVRTRLGQIDFLVYPELALTFRGESGSNRLEIAGSPKKAEWLLRKVGGKRVER